MDSSSLSMWTSFLSFLIWAWSQRHISWTTWLFSFREQNTMQTINKSKTLFYSVMTSQKSCCVWCVRTHCCAVVFIHSSVRLDALHSAGETQSRELQGILIITQSREKETALRLMDVSTTYRVFHVCSLSVDVGHQHSVAVPSYRNGQLQFIIHVLQQRKDNHLNIQI